jgi:predicted amidohydrolase
LLSLGAIVMPRNVRIAICQFESAPPTSPSNVERNFGRFETFVADAAERGADLVVFPEYALQGIIAQHQHLAEDEGEWLKPLQQLAAKNKIDIVPGTIVERGPEISRPSRPLHNVAYYIDHTGKVIGKYKKRNLWHP